jgi:hypothetical protein
LHSNTSNNTTPQQALESLSSSTPSIQLTRLKALYTDLLDALSPLFPLQHPLIHSLSYPIPPTSSPLHSALALLREILIALRQRCAPVRDPDIDVLLAKIDDNPHPQPSYIRDTSSQARLASLVIDVFRSLVTLADTLKSDLTQSVLGMMSEAQLAGVVAQQARIRERKLVLEMWGGVEDVRVAWRKWVSWEEEGIDKETARKRWVTKLIKSLASPVPISCVVPDSRPQNVSPASSTTELPTKNELPPQFFFTAPTLFYLQNLLQALVIAASLRSLTRIPLITSDSPASDSMSRVWTLLEAEIDRDVFAIGVGPTRDRGEDPTKIINLADEVIRARRLLSASSGETTTSNEEEKALRGAVERTLRPEDPVFLLLMGRLVSAVEGGVVRWLVEDASTDAGVGRGGVPERMRAGRVVGPQQDFEGVHRALESDNDKKALKLEAVKGFEDPVLARGINDLVMKVIHCVQWTEGVWGDLIS